MKPRRRERQPPRLLDRTKPLPSHGVGVARLREEHARVAREARADRAHQQDRRAEAAVEEVLPAANAGLERGLVHEREVAVHVVEVELDERI